MSDFLTRLAERQLAAVPAVAPRAPSRFAPVAPVVLSEAQVAAATPHARAVEEAQGATTQRVVVRVDTERQIETVVTSPVDGPSQTAVTSAPHQPSSLPVSPSSSPQRDRRIDAPIESPLVRVPERLVPLPGDTALPPAPIETRHEQTAPEGSRHDSTPLRFAEPPHPPTLLVPAAPQAAGIAHPFAPEVEPRSIARPDPAPVTITIGRIEVRAVTPPPRRERATVDRHKALSLEDYLDRRRGGRR